MKPRQPDLTDFVPIRAGRCLLYLHRDLADSASVILSRIDEMDPNSGAGEGTRQSGFAIALDGGQQVFLRRSRRGGLLAMINRDLYFGIRARPLRELAVAAEVYRRGLPVAEPLGAMVESVAPAVYRAAILTRALPGMTLWQFVRTDDDSGVRAHVLTQARRAIDRIHQGGLFHADLNLHNLFVTHAGESFAVVILDLDKARLYRAPLAPRLCRINLRRLARSARKLDPDGSLLDPAALGILTEEPE